MPNETVEALVLHQLGNPAEAARQLARFRRAAKALSFKHPRFIEEFPQQWIVVYVGEVRAQGESLHSALLQAERLNIPVEKAIVRFIDRNERTYILLTMLRGRFGDTSGRPYLEGRLFLPRLKLQGDISFIVDTGAELPRTWDTTRRRGGHLRQLR